MDEFLQYVSHYDEFSNKKSSDTSVTTDTKVSEESIAMENTLRDIKDKVLNRNISTIKEKKMIMNQFTSAMSTAVSPELFKQMNKNVILEVWKVLINFFNNLNKKNISDIIKTKSQYITDHSLDDYLMNKDSVVDKSIILRMSELLDFLNALAKLLNVAKYHFTNGEDFSDLISWVIDQVIGEDLTIFGDYVENFYDLNGKYSELYRFHYQTMLNVVLINPQLLDRNLYDKLLESQYLIFTDENTSRFSNCYNLSIKILGRVMKHRLLGKVHGTWEKLLVNAFKNFLMDSYTVKKIDDDLFYLTQYMLEWSFVFDNENYAVTSRVLVDNIIKAKGIDSSVLSFLKRYLDFLPHDTEYQIGIEGKKIFLDDLLRLIKFLLLMIIESNNSERSLVPETYEFKEFPQKSSDIKLRDYEYVNSTDELNITAEYLAVYFSIKRCLFMPQSEFHQNQPPLDNSRVKKDVINYIMPIIRNNPSLDSLISKLDNASTESINFEKIVPLLTTIISKYDSISLPGETTVKSIMDNKKLNVGQKCMFYSSLIVNCLERKQMINVYFNIDLIKDELFIAFTEALSILNQNIPSMTYFVSLFADWMYTEKHSFPQDQWVKIKAKIGDILRNIKIQSPVGSSLEIFKFWRSICLLVPYMDNHSLQKKPSEEESLIFEGFEFRQSKMELYADELSDSDDGMRSPPQKSRKMDLEKVKNYERADGLTTFELILKEWLPIASITEDALSFSNFFYWGYSQEIDTLKKDSAYQQQKLVNLCNSESNIGKKKCNICKEESNSNFSEEIINREKGSSSLPFIKPKVLLDKDNSILPQDFAMKLDLDRRTNLYHLTMAKPSTTKNCVNKKCMNFKNNEVLDIYEGRGKFRSYKALFYLIKYLEKMYSEQRPNNGLGWMRLLLYLSEDSINGFGDIHKQLNSLIDRVVLPRSRYTGEYMVSLISNYDIFSIEYLTPKYFHTFEQLVMGFDQSAFYNILDCEKDITYFCQMFQDTTLVPFHQLTDNYKWDTFKSRLLEVSDGFNNASVVDVFLHTFTKKVSSLSSEKKTEIVDDLISNIKDEVNSEKCHDVHLLKMFLLIIGKILASPILMDGNSKNKILKLWTSLHDMSISGIYQAGSIECMENLFKRLDFKSQNSVLMSIKKSLIDKQNVQLQLEMFTSLAKVSRSLMTICFKMFVPLVTEETYTMFRLMLHELCLWYNFYDNRDLFAALGYDFMVWIIADLLNSNLLDVPTHVYLSLNGLLGQFELINPYEICDLLLRLKNLSHLFVASCLVVSNDVNKLKSLGILEFQTNDVIKTNVLYPVLKKENQVKVVDNLQLSDVRSLVSRDYYNYILFKEQLQLLDTSSLASMASGFLTVCPNFDTSVLQNILQEGKPISFLKVTSLQVPDLLITDPELYKEKDSPSSLQIEIAILSMLTDPTTPFSVYEFAISGLRKLKLVYLLMLGMTSNQAVIDRVTENFLDYLVKIDNFEMLFDTFKSFMFELMSKVNSKNLCYEIKLKVMTRLFSVRSKLGTDVKDDINRFVVTKGIKNPVFTYIYHRIYGDELPEDPPWDEMENLSLTSSINSMEDLNEFITDLLLETDFASEYIKRVLCFRYSHDAYLLVDYTKLSSVYTNKMLCEPESTFGDTPKNTERNYLTLVGKSMVDLRKGSRTLTDLLRFSLLSLALHLSSEFQNADEDLEEDFFGLIEKFNLHLNLEYTMSMNDLTDILGYEEDRKIITKFGEGNHFASSGYMDWMHSLWEHLALYLPSNLFLNFIPKIDEKFNSTTFTERFLFAALVNVTTDMDKNLAFQWGKSFNILLEENFHFIYDFKPKATTFLNLFLHIRRLKDEKIRSPELSHSEQYKQIYSNFVLSDMVRLCLSLEQYELAFMIADEDPTLKRDTHTWRKIFKGIDSEYDIFLKTSIPMELDLTKYLKNSKDYCNDTRFNKSVLGFNLASVEANYQESISMNNIKYSFAMQGEHYLANSLNIQQNDNCDFNKDFENTYNELQSWDMPLSDNNNVESCLRNMNKAGLIIKEKAVGLVDRYGTDLLSKFFMNSGNKIKESKLELNDARQVSLYNMANEEFNNSIETFIDASWTLLSSHNEIEGLDLYSRVKARISGFNNYYLKMNEKQKIDVLTFHNEKLKVKLYTDIFVDNLAFKSKFDSVRPQVPSKEVLNKLGFQHLMNLGFIINQAESQSSESFNLPIKELVKAQKFIEFIESYDFDGREECKDTLCLMNLICRWNSGDTVSSFYHLNNMLDRYKSEKADDFFTSILELNRIKWTLESKKEPLQTIWNDYYKLLSDVKKSDSTKNRLFVYHTEDLFTVNSYYFNVVTSRLNNYSPDYKEMDRLLRKYYEIKDQLKDCKTYLTLFQNDPEKKKKMTATYQVAVANEKFVGERFNELQKTIKEHRVELIDMTVALISLLSQQICKPGIDGYKQSENIDMFFTVWFELIDLFNKDYFDIDSIGNKEVMQLQVQNKSVNFDHVLEFETIAKMPKNEEDKEANWCKSRVMFVSWTSVLKPWAEAMDRILSANKDACVSWLGTIFAKMSTGHIEVNENCNAFSVLLECYLNKIVIACVKEYPEHTIHLANTYINYSSDNNEKAKLRSSLISTLISSLVVQDPQLMQIVDNYKSFSDIIKDLALTTKLKTVTSISLKETQNCKAIFQKSPEEVYSVFNSSRKVLFPMIDFKKWSMVKNYGLNHYISGIDDIINLSTSGLSRPRIFSFHMDDGTKHKVLVKGNDDLKPDEIMLKAMKKINDSIFKNREGPLLKYKLLTYNVFPMGYNFGMMEFMKNVSSLNDILKPMHKADDIQHEELRKKMDASYKAKATPQARVKVFTDMCNSVTPRFNEYFRKNFLTPEDWYKAKKTYAMSLAITSIVGYILGIGDRHMSNVMMNCQTGDLVHIDFGITFDGGKKLIIPEKVPFRYTRDIRDALGVYETYGAIKRFFEDVYGTLRKNQLVVSLSLMNLKLDPLYKWSLEVNTKALRLMLDMWDYELELGSDSERDSDDDSDSDYDSDDYYDNQRKRKPQKPKRQNKTTALFDVKYKTTGSQGVGSFLYVLKKPTINYSITEEYSKKCLDTVSDKLLGGKERQSVESCVERLLNEAKSDDNLGVIFCGWCPFY